jgi:hypothetical protein
MVLGASFCTFPMVFTPQIYTFPMISANNPLKKTKKMMYFLAKTLVFLKLSYYLRNHKSK